MFYLTTHSTHFIYGYIASVIANRSMTTLLICACLFVMKHITINNILVNVFENNRQFGSLRMSGTILKLPLIQQ